MLSSRLPPRCTRKASATNASSRQAAAPVTSAPGQRRGRGGATIASEASGSGGSASRRYSAGGSASPVTYGVATRRRTRSRTITRRGAEATRARRLPGAWEAHPPPRSRARARADEARQQLELRAALAEGEAEVAVEDVQDDVVDGHVHAQAAARLAQAVAQVVADGADHGQPREHGVAVDAGAVRARLAHHQLHAELAREVRGLVGRRHDVAVLADDLLQPHDVGIHLRDDDADAVEVPAAVQTDAPGDVVGGDGDRRHAADSRSGTSR